MNQEVIILGEARIGRFDLVAALLATGLCLVIAAVTMAPPAEARLCHTAAQTIEKRKNISCKQAKRVIRMVHRRARGPLECRGDYARVRGWVVRGIPPRGKFIPLRAKFKKGKKSFHLVGGGTC